MRLLHVGVHHVRRWISENKSQPYAGTDGPRHFWKPVPLPGLRQDFDLHDARGGKHAEGDSCLIPNGNPISRSLERNIKFWARTTPRPIFMQKSPARRNTRKISVSMACCFANC